jgi:MFS family permease
MGDLAPEAGVLAAFLLWFFLPALVCGWIGWLIGRRIMRDVAGFFLGFLLGPFGWLVAVLLKDGRPLCVKCYTPNHEYASVCRACREKIETL